MPLKHEGFQVGQKIRAYDFEPRAAHGQEHYVEGEIVEVCRDGSQDGPRFAHYVITCSRDVENGAEVQDRVGQKVYVPMQTMMFEWDGRVAVL